MKAKRLYWTICTSVFAAGVLTLSVSPWWMFTVNLTHSLPGTLYVIHKGASIQKGDLMAYRWQGGATYPAGVTFIKRVVGVAGDTVKRVGSDLWVEDQYIGTAKPYSKAGVPLQAVPAGRIDRGEYFVATPDPDSLDSRYTLNGNVRQADVIGKAYEVF